jgi:hypothetical protein
MARHDSFIASLWAAASFTGRHDGCRRLTWLRSPDVLGTLRVKLSASPRLYAQLRGNAGAAHGRRASGRGGRDLRTELCGPGMAFACNFLRRRSSLELCRERGHFTGCWSISSLHRSVKKACGLIAGRHPLFSSDSPIGVPECGFLERQPSATLTCRQSTCPCTALRAGMPSFDPLSAAHAARTHPAAGRWQRRRARFLRA